MSCVMYGRPRFAMALAYVTPNVMVEKLSSIQVVLGRPQREEPREDVLVACVTN